MIKKTGRAIILNENSEIVTIKRTKYNNKIIKEYYTLPGGHLEKNESFEEATIREVKEELGINVSILSEFYSFYNIDLEQDEKFYICKYNSGKIGTGTGEEWNNNDYVKYGKYEIVYLKIKELEKYNLLPKEVKDLIIKNIS